MQSLASQADWKIILLYFGSGIMFNSLAFGEIGESIHKFKLGGDLRDEARSLRAALDRHLLESVIKKGPNFPLSFE